MTSEITRRAALGFAGATSLTLLAACGSGTAINGSSSESSSAAKKDYKGEVKLEEYDTSAGTFEPATHDTPPKNVPKPIKPKNADEDSVAGLYSSIAFIGAALTYALVTGDVGPINESALSEEDQKGFKSAVTLDKIREGKYWEAESKVVIFLETSEPTKEGDEYIWPHKMESRHGAFRVDVTETSTERSVEVSTIPTSQQVSKGGGKIKAKYTGGRWVIDFEFDKSSSSASPSY
ncbi:DUF6318 family protein [Rothia aeria]|jgi:hypothetical protein|uniref:DUF6318 family protein n=1 Tax=Rothia aeria TaxID=172042 RepID=UPI002549D97F|nr:DUF6318 family protein [Rothia aeria]MDK7352270.1 DUF6318 family protein [Rothia aeria]